MLLRITSQWRSSRKKTRKKTGTLGEKYQSSRTIESLEWKDKTDLQIALLTCIQSAFNTEVT